MSEASRAAERMNGGEAGGGGAVVYTMGHGQLPAERFLELLRNFGIGQVADVRAVPNSRHAPQFERKVLSPFLRIRRIKYLHLKELGGVRRHTGDDSPNKGWRNASLRGYADYMLTPPFRASLSRVVQLAQLRVTVLLCTEESPWRCHRSLIADALVVRGFRVLHIGGDGLIAEHALSPLAVVEGERITYPPR